MFFSCLVVRLDISSFLDFRNALRCFWAAKKKDSPLDILQKRFASGHITNEEYQQRKKILVGDLAKQS